MNFFLKFFILVTVYIRLSVSYIYPIVCEKCSTKEDSSFNKHVHVAEESEFIRDLTNNILIPINNGLCNLWVNFFEVYDCVMSHYAPKESTVGNSKEKTALQSFWSLFGLYRKEEHVTKCSYYSITIVTSSLLLFAALLYSTKKMVDYFREEDFLDINCARLKKGSFNRRLNICNCKLNDAF